MPTQLRQIRSILIIVGGIGLTGLLLTGCSVSNLLKQKNSDQNMTGKTNSQTDQNYVPSNVDDESLDQPQPNDAYSESDMGLESLPTDSPVNAQ